MRLGMEIAELVVIGRDEDVGIQGGVRGGEPAGDQGRGSPVPLVAAPRAGDLERECGGGLYWVGFGQGRENVARPGSD